MTLAPKPVPAPMARSPEWFQPLSPADVATLAELFERATGVSLAVPPLAGQTPAAWLANVDAVAGPHVARMMTLGSQFRARKQPFFYDPQTRTFHDAQSCDRIS